MKLTNRSRGLHAAVWTFVPAVLFGWNVASAQDSPGLLQVAQVQVKMGRTQEFEDLQRQAAEAGRAAGRTGRGLWQEVRGGTGMYHIVETHDSFSAIANDEGPPMSPEDWARWVSRITQTISSRKLLNLRTYPDLSIPDNEDEENDMVVLRIRTVRPGMNNEYEEWIRENLSPALREGGEDGVSWFRVVAGGNTNTWYSATNHSDWSELDPPGVLSYMSERRRESMLEEGAAMTTGDWSTVVLQYRADLSY